MCGIAGYIGTSNAKDELINCLKLLEYRGYDSAGIAVFDADKILTTKCAGKISNLEKIITQDKACCGIAHTRWATHGLASFENSHPHSSNNEKWCIVHNGIIENYSEIKNQLKKENYSFKSQTDTEVVANLLQKNETTTPLKTLIKTCNMLKGSYALACLHQDFPNNIFLAKNKSPLYVAHKNECIYIASDPICFAKKVDEYYSLQDEQFCQASPSGITFFDKFGNEIQAIPHKNYNISSLIDKGQYEFFMEKEIFETTQILKNIIKKYTNSHFFANFNANFIKKFNNIVFIGCGTAYHAGLMGAKYFEKIVRIKSSCHIASEYRYSSPIIDEKTLCILVSQSGETADTLAVCELAKTHKATTIALTNVTYSTLAHMADYILPVFAGSEIAVASTKAYTAQIAILYIFANYIKNQLSSKNTDIYKKIAKIANNFEIKYQKTLNNVIKTILSAEKVFFIGRDYDYITVKEASLKLKEITYIPTAEHPAGELKHGFLSLVDSNSVVIVLATQKDLLPKTLNGANEVLSRGGKIIFASQYNIPKEQSKDFSHIIKLSKYDDDIMPIISVIYFQLLAYKTAITKNLNPDQPRNLAKSVTVE